MLLCMCVVLWLTHFCNDLILQLLISLMLCCNNYTIMLCFPYFMCLQLLVMLHIFFLMLKLLCVSSSQRLQEISEGLGDFLFKHKHTLQTFVM